MDTPASQPAVNPAPSTPAPTPTPVPASTSGGGSGKKLLFIAVGALLLILILGLVAFYFLRGNQANSNKPVTLTYWGLWESPEIMQPLIDQYHQDHPNVTINYEQRPIDQHYATVKARISQASTSNNQPDIVRVHNSWVPVLANYLSPVPASAYSREEYESVFYNVTKDNLLLNGQYYGIPLMMDGLALVYNQELFNTAGISAPPSTWDDVRHDAAKITQRDQNGNLTIAGIAMGSAKNVDHFADIIGLLMAQNSVAFKDGNGNVAFDKSISADGRNLGAEALAFFNLFSTVEKGWDDTMEPSTLAFSKGKVGMILIPSWRVLSLVDQNPELQIRVAPVPHLTTNQKVGYASYWVEAVPASSPNQAEAWKFLRYLSEREQQLTMFNAAQQTRSFGEPYSRKDLADSLSTDPLLAPFGSQAANYTSSLFATNTGAAELNGAINAALAQAITQAKTTESAEAALTTLAEKVTSILTQERQ